MKILPTTIRNIEHTIAPTKSLVTRILMVTIHIHCECKRRTLPVQWTSYRNANSDWTKLGRFLKSLILFGVCFQFFSVHLLINYECYVIKNLQKMTVPQLKRTDQPLNDVYNFEYVINSSLDDFFFRFLIPSICSVPIERRRTIIVADTMH